MGRNSLPTQIAPFDIYISLCKLNAANLIVDAYRRFQRRKLEARVRHVTTIQRAWRMILQRKAENRAQIVLGRFWRKYKRNKEYLKSTECLAVRKIQAFLDEQRKMLPSLPAKQYNTLVAIMVTEGVELLVKLEDLHKEYDIVVLKTKDPSKTTQTKLDRINKNISKPWQTLFQAAKTPCLEVQEKALRQKVSSGMKMVDNAMKELNRFGSRVPVEAHLQPNKSAGPNKNEVKGKGGARGQGKKGKKGRRT